MKWRRARHGFPQDLLDEEMRKIAFSIKKLEARLSESPWLAGPDYTLADICNFAIANGMQFGFPEFVNEAETPGILRWLKQINDRLRALADAVEVLALEDIEEVPLAAGEGGDAGRQADRVQVTLDAGGGGVDHLFVAGVGQQNPQPTGLQTRQSARELDQVERCSGNHDTLRMVLGHEFVRKPDHRLDQIRRVGGIGMMIGKLSIHIHIQKMVLTRQHLDQLLDCRSRRAIARVPADAERQRRVVGIHLRHGPAARWPFERDLDYAIAAYWAKFLIDRAHQ